MTALKVVFSKFGRSKVKFFREFWQIFYFNFDYQKKFSLKVDSKGYSSLNYFHFLFIDSNIFELSYVLQKLIAFIN